MISTICLLLCILAEQTWSSQSERVSSAVMKACCTYGKVHGDKVHPHACDESEAVLPGILPYERSICKGIWASCCLKQKRAGVCTDGVQKALENLPCSSLGSRECSDQKYCCSCCKVGLKIGASSQQCDIQTTSGCDGIVKRCCVKIKQNSTLREIIDPKIKPKQKLTCAHRPCSHICVNTNTGVRCMCRLGFKLEKDLTTCSDLDECAGNRNICGARYECVNSRGSYRCVRRKEVIRCPKGRESNGTKCIDIDECKRQPNTCGAYGKCINWPGTYLCRCNEGYKFVTHEGTCKDIDECRLRGVCSQRCENTNGSFKCHCRTGYKLDSSNKICKDINECLTSNPCHHECVNIAGSYVCTCKVGYTLEADKLRCKQDRKACSFSPCQWQCKDLPNGTYKCICPANYKLHSDGKSCLYKPNDPCENNRCQWKCERVENNYRCLCPAGQRLDTDGRKCKTPDPCENHRCQWKCERVGNSYRCLCPAGQRLDSDGKKCRARDPCENNRCQWKCEGVGNSYRCLCPAGQRLDSDGRKCRARDPCENNRCQWKCEGVGNNYRCLCPAGQRLETDGIRCREVNPCLQYPCEYRCRNIGGGRHTCSCPHGKILNADGRTCTVKDVCKNKHCQYKCERESSTRHRCTCPGGYSLKYNRRDCRDINECDQGSHRCQRKTSQCFNTWGHYQCIPISCPKKYFRRVTNSYCVRSSCQKGDKECQGDINYSYQWLATNEPNGRPVDKVSYFYSLRRPSYRHQVRFVIHSGNDDQVFYLRKRESYRVYLRNRKKLVGPKNYKIVLHINIYRNGKIYTRLVNVFYVHVSAYNFF